MPGFVVGSASRLVHGTIVGQVREPIRVLIHDGLLIQDELGIMYT